LKEEPKTFANALAVSGFEHEGRRRQLQKFFVSFFQKRKPFSFATARVNAARC
jgi:hypothetical protein